MEPAGAAFQLQLEVRSDAEQQAKMEETVELLLVAGYFRARLAALTAFDKVVGGMVWCISQCNVDIDVDLLYSESATIGQKIALTEKIVSSLGKMRCPRRLEPHQIQGLDFVHIYPVVQWLVQRAVEARRDNADLLTAYGAYTFRTAIAKGDTNSVREKAVAKSADVTVRLGSAATPPRVYKRNADLLVENAADRAHCTLLEYAWRRKLAGAAASNAGQECAPQGGQSAETGEADEAGAHLMVGLSEVPLAQAGEHYAVSGDKVRQMLSEAAGGAQPSAHIAAVRYEPADGAHTHALARECRSSPHDDVNVSLSDDIASVERQVDEVRAALANERAATSEVHEKLAQIGDNFARLTGLQSTNDARVVDELRELIERHGEIKAAESAFKQHCREELGEMQRELDMLSSVAEPDTSNVDLSRVQAQCESAEGRLSADRLQLAQVNRRIASLQRTLDSVPSQVELAQYQKRFLELYNQMSSKHRETRQFYILHNNLLDVQKFMEKEIELMESIYNIRVQASAAEYRSSFAQSMRDILAFAERNNAKIESGRKEEEGRRDALRDQLQEVHDKQRLYYTTADDLAKAVKRHEHLQNKLAAAEKCSH